MSALDAVLQLRSQDERRRQFESAKLSSALQNFVSNRQQANELSLQREESNLNRIIQMKQMENIDSQIAERGKTSKLDQFLQMGKVGEAYKNLVESGMIQAPGDSPVQSVNSALDPIATIPVGVASNIDSSNKKRQLIPDKFNSLGVATSYMNPVAEEAKNNLEIEKGIKKTEVENKANATNRISGTKNFIRNFSESRDEIINSGLENIGKADMGGFGERIIAKVKEKTGTLPKTTAFINRIEVIANQSARDIEGGRVTDQDRSVYTKAMANAIKFPDDTNIKLTAESLVDMDLLGGDINPVLDEFRSSNVDIFNKIAKEVDRVRGNNEDKDIKDMSDKELEDLISRLSNGGG